MVIERNKPNLGMFDMLIDSYRASGLLPN